MKKVILMLAAMAALQSGLVLASNSGTISFTGAIVKEPCAQSESSLLKYAQNPRLYQAARKETGSQVCSGLNSTQSLSISSVGMANGNAQGTGQIVTVVYN
ncbi:hypothetical protein [Chromobacterium amazonense]|uniref:Type 1 fimbrial protein n=2 Tax=Chromobacterium amazonense TaxID=1382803 RepID=A0ABU8V5Y5_9NEIS|nr:hypothetical protein [Chromobacterium amazonense]KIA79125.1 hypothetical protein QR66_17595 [Chromobacterium piscinae]MDE1712810.1 hypothetical protein [Chromobacterium amazonense]MDQ4540623.1 hypothetical protein [Chromobacterium amazonense]OHX18742.1 hypothetical protein BI343_00095 [Chromobacterium amazonense]